MHTHGLPVMASPICIPGLATVARYALVLGWLPDVPSHLNIGGRSFRGD